MVDPLADRLERLAPEVDAAVTWQDLDRRLRAGLARRRRQRSIVALGLVGVAGVGGWQLIDRDNPRVVTSPPPTSATAATDPSMPSAASAVMADEPWVGPLQEAIEERVGLGLVQVAALVDDARTRDITSCLAETGYGTDPAVVHAYLVPPRDAVTAGEAALNQLAREHLEIDDPAAMAAWAECNRRGVEAHPSPVPPLPSLIAPRGSLDAANAAYRDCLNAVALNQQELTDLRANYAARASQIVGDIQGGTAPAAGGEAEAELERLDAEERALNALIEPCATPLEAAEHAAVEAVHVDFLGANPQFATDTANTITSALRDDQLVPNEPLPSVEWTSPQASLAATTMLVVADGTPFAPSVPLVGGNANLSTPSLEVTWPDGDHDLHVELYFDSDDSDWWISRVAVGYGDDADARISADGPFYRTPLGRAYRGDLTIPLTNDETGGGRIGLILATNVTLQAITHPPRGDTPTTPPRSTSHLGTDGTGTT